MKSLGLVPPYSGRGVGGIVTPQQVRGGCKGRNPHGNISPVTVPSKERLRHFFLTFLVLSYKIASPTTPILRFFQVKSHPPTEAENPSIEGPRYLLVHKKTGWKKPETLEIAHFPLSLLADPFFGQRYVQVLGQRKLYHAVQYTGGAAELDFFVEGLRFPDETFPGLVSIYVSLLETLAEVWGSRGRGADGRLQQPEGDGD